MKRAIQMNKTYDDVVDQMAQKLGELQWHSLMGGDMIPHVDGVRHVAYTIAYMFDEDPDWVFDDLYRRLDAFYEYLIEEQRS